MPKLVQVDGIGTVEFADDFTDKDIAKQVGKLYAQQDEKAAVVRYGQRGSGEEAVIADLAAPGKPAPVPWWKRIPSILAPPTELEGAFTPEGDMASPAEGMAAGGKFLAAGVADLGLTLVGHPTTENITAVGTDPLAAPLPAERELAALDSVQGAAAKGALSVPKAIPALAAGTIAAPVVSPFVSYPAAFGIQTLGETGDKGAAAKSAAIAALFPLVGKAVEPLVVGLGERLIAQGLIKPGNEAALKAVEATLKQTAFQTAAQIVNVPEYIEATPEERIRLLAETTAANMVFAIPDAINIPRASVPSDTSRAMTVAAANAIRQSLLQPPPPPVQGPPAPPVLLGPPAPPVLGPPAPPAPAPRQRLPGADAQIEAARIQREAEIEAARVQREAERAGTAPTPPQLVVGEEPGPGQYRVTDESVMAETQARQAPLADPNAPIGTVRVGTPPPVDLPAVLVPPGAAMPEVPEGRATFDAGSKGTVIFDPVRISPQAVNAAIDKLPEPQEPPQNEPAPGQPSPNPPGVDVREPTGAGAKPPAEQPTAPAPGPEVSGSPPPGGPTETGTGTERGGGVPSGPGPGPGPGGRPGPVEQAPGPAATAGPEGGLPPPGRELDTNHVLPAGEDWIPSGDKAKVRANLDAIALLKRLEAQNRNATPEEKAVLARYTGWGGVKPVFDEGKAAYRARPPLNEVQRTEAANWERQWGKLYDETKSALSPEEHAAAARSILNAHYTSREVINGIWQAVQHLGFRGGRALEPASGVGHFIGLTPESLRGAVSWNAVEMDSISARLAQKLYPQARVQETGFQSSRLSPNSQDLVISNVPFDRKGPTDKRYPAMSLHNYFFARALDVVKPGGLVAAITSDSTMDSPSSRAAREYFAEKADLVGAIRLPNTAFKKNAGTEVTTDVLFFRKRDGTAYQGERFLNAVPAETYKGQPILLNEYFAAHPEMMLGRMSKEGTMYGPEQQALLPTPGADLARQMEEAVAKLPKDVVGAARPVEAEAPVAERSAKLGQLKIKDGVAYQVQPDGSLAKTDWGDDKKKVAQAASYITLVDGSKAHIAKMLDANATDADVAQSRVALNREYDAYFKKYGAINERRAAFLDDDVDFPLALALEDANTRLVEVAGKAKRITEWSKSKMFSERTIFPRQAPGHVDTVPDGLQVSQGYLGKVDPDYIAKLTGRPVQSVQQELESSGLAFENPASGLWEGRATYLSGQVRDKLVAARNAVESDPRYARHVAELEKVQPPAVAVDNIGFKLGSVFMPEDIIAAFIRDTLLVDARVSYTKETGTWSVVADKLSASNVKNQTTFGIHGWNGHDLVEQSLNLKSANVTKQVPKDGGGTSEVRDAEKSLQAQEKQDALQKEFKQYVLRSPEKAQRVAQIYNERYNGVVAPKFDPPTWAHYPMASQDIRLRDHQKAVVTRMLQNSTLLAHAVGTGKTYAMVTAAMEMRRLGLAKKPMIVVQNATLEQFARSFKRLYPSARILAPNAKQRDAINRNRTMSRIATGDWDAVIVPQSFVNMLPDDPVREQKYVQDRIAELVEARLEAARTGGEKSPKAADIQRLIDKLNVRLTDLGNRKKDNVLTFEQLGVDAMFVDEAHAYKKLEFSTQMDNVKGLDKGASQRGWSMSMKTRWVQEKNQGRNVIFATGTPVSNTIAEAWTMMRYVRPDVLKAYDIERFDDFASTFGDTVTQLEMTAGGSWKPVTRFARYVNGPELIAAWRTVADVVTPEEINLPGLPALKNGKVTIHNIPQSPAIKNYVASLRARLEEFAAMTGMQKRQNSHIPLVVFGNAKKASLDMRMIDPDLPDQPGSKLNVAADTVAQTYRDSTSVKGAQMVFSDAFQNDPDNPRFNLYEELRRKLVARGVPEDQVVIITDKIKDAKRDALFTKVNDGDVRVVIGSTERMGVGVNAQEHLVALHHLDAPARPMDIEQRNGRIVRQGNQNQEVEIHSYGVENTLDAALFQKLATKQKFINQILRGDLQGRNFEDAANEQSLTFEEQMAAFAGDKRAMEKVALDNQVRQLEGLRSGHLEQMRKAQESIQRLVKTTIPETERRLEASRATAQQLAQAFAGEELTAQVEGRTVSGRVDVAKALDNYFGNHIKKAIGDARASGQVGKYHTADIPGIVVNGQPVSLIVHVPVNTDGVFEPEKANVHWVFSGAGVSGSHVRSGAGFFQSLDAALERAANGPATVQGDLDRAKRDLIELGGFVKQPFEREAELVAARAKSAALNAELAAEGQAPTGQEAPPEAGEERVHGFSGGNTSLWKAAAKDVAGLRNLVAPQVGGGPARFGGNLLRELNAKMENQLARADLALRSFRRDFDRTPVNLRKFRYDPTVPLPRNLAFIDAYETGNTSAMSATDALAASELHQLNTQDLARVQALGTGALTKFYLNYFPHIWDDPTKAASVMSRLLGKAPLEGPKAFLKRRTHQLFVEGLAAGLKPVHDNPIDLWLLKKREVERYILAHDFIREMKDAGLLRFKYAFGKAPEGWVTVNDRAFSVYGPPTVTIKEAFDAGMREATIDLLRSLGVPHERLARIGGKRWGYEVDTGTPGGERIVTKFAGPDFVIWHELGHVLDNRYRDLRPTLSATDLMNEELRALADERINQTDPKSFARYVRKMEEKIAVALQAYVHAPELMQRVAPTVKAALETFIKAHPELEPLNDIQPGLRLGVGESEITHGGLLKLGDYVMPEAAARVVNNFLSPGLNPHLWYRTLRQTSNLLNGVQLGLSAFHLGFTSLDAATSRLAIGLEDVAHGKPVSALRAFASVPVSPLTNIRTGAKLRAEVLRPGTFPQMAGLARALEQAGGRVGADAFWQTEFTRRMTRAWHQGGLQWATLPIRLPLAAWEQTMRPILEYVVPRQKLGVFADMAKRELVRLGPTASEADTRAALAKAWDSVDNRMGQVVYDNLFHNRAVKDIALLAFRAYGWQLGKYREGLGAVADTLRAGGRILHGERPEFSHRMAYAMALPVMVGTIGGTLHYLFNGAAPQTAIDYFQPQTGETDRNGNPVRLNLPSYVKDALAYARHPLTSLGHSLNPLLSSMFDLLSNRDFYNVAIRNPDDPLLKQGGDVAEFALKQFVPFSVSGGQKLAEEDAPAWKRFAPYFGFTPVPQRLTMSPSQELAAEIMAARMPAGATTKEKFDEAKMRGEIVNLLRRGQTEQGLDKLKDAVDARQITKDQLRVMLEKLQWSPYQFQVHMMASDEAMRVWRIASPEERAKISYLVLSKLAKSRTLSQEQKVKFGKELLGR